MAMDKKQTVLIAETGVMANQLVDFDINQKPPFYCKDVQNGGSFRHIYYH